MALRAVTLPLMSWLVAPELLAQFALWQLALGFGVLLAGQGLGHALVRDFHELSVPEQQQLLAQLFIVALVLGGLIAVVMFALTAPMVSIFSGFSPPSAIWFMLPILMIMQWGTSFLRLSQLARAFALMQIGGRVVWLLLLLAMWWFSNGQGLRSAQQLLTLWFVAELLNTAVLLWLIRTQLSQAFALRRDWFAAVWRQRFGAMLTYARPLLLSEGLYWAMGALGAVLLTAWHGLSSMAIYAMAVAVGSVGSMAGQVFNTVWLPEVYKSYQSSGELPWLPRRALQLTLLALCFVVVAALASVVLWWVLPASYEQVPYLVAATALKPILMALQRVSAIGIELRRVTWVSPLAMVSGLALQLFFAWWLIPVYAAAGAIVSLLLGALVFWTVKTVMASILWQPIGASKIISLVWFAAGLACFVALSSV
ncbi:hypothetical protein CWI83_04980 [Pseudidiomarina taiwanensis]|uniref:Polysaccharide biosynthesis protein n=2 Tax=Pseudidiomarina taiwanensis TaxID=337250 RepID=A0A432ZK80_9GAMM|nr:hypothetical protein CWI83_04980 [Pseudidiomarina taiwanensis]